MWLDQQVRRQINEYLFNLSWDFLIWTLVPLALVPTGTSGPAHVVKDTICMTAILKRALIDPVRIEYFGENPDASALARSSAESGTRRRRV